MSKENNNIIELDVILLLLLSPVLGCRKFEAELTAPNEKPKISRTTFSNIYSGKKNPLNSKVSTFLILQKWLNELDADIRKEYIEKAKEKGSDILKKLKKEDGISVSVVDLDVVRNAIEDSDTYKTSEITKKTELTRMERSVLSRNLRPLEGVTMIKVASIQEFVNSKK